MDDETKPNWWECDLTHPASIREKYLEPPMNADKTVLVFICVHLRSSAAHFLFFL
jgi:hypothetical protein